MTNSTELPDVDYALRSPVGALLQVQSHYRHIEKTYQAQLRQMLALAYAAYSALAEDNDKMIDFFEHCDGDEELKKLIKSDAHLLRVVLSFTFNSSHGYNRAHKYFRALELYTIEEVPPEEVEALIKEQGGIDAVYDRAKKALPSKGKSDEEKAAARDKLVAAIRSGQQGTADDQNSQDADDNDEDDLFGNSKELTVGEDADEAGPEDSNSQSEANKKKSKAAAKKVEQLAPSTSGNSTVSKKPTLEVEVSDEELETLLGMKKGERYWLKIACRGREDGWVRFGLTDMARHRPKPIGGSAEDKRVDNKAQAAL